MKKFTITEYGIIILAAGDSRRMRRPKQLLDFNGQSLVRHAAWTALSTDAAFVMVITGAMHREVSAEIEDLPVIRVKNRFWEEGMASSLRRGILFAQEKKKWKGGLLVMPCDMPFISKALIEKLVRAQDESGLPIAASKNADYLGMPAIFHRSMLGELLALQGDAAPRTMIADQIEFTVPVDFPMALINLDTPADYEKVMEISGMAIA